MQTDAVERALEKVLASTAFSRTQRLRRFLEYVVVESLAGRSDRLKEYAIGAVVFDRGPDFDPRLDTIVRVEAIKLRERLKDYYRGEGATDPVVIELPKGSYVPQFVFRQGASSQTSPQLPHAPARAAPMDERPTIAVLSFVNMSADRRSDYLADGFADTIITELAKASGLLVISRQSSFAHRDSKLPLPEIAAALRVRYLIEGSVHADEGHLRVSVNLIDTASDHSLWAESYERRFREIFSVREEVCRSIVRALRVKLTPSESTRIGRLGTRSIDAHDELLRGLDKFWQYSRETCAEARHHFSRAVALDPDYAAAHAWLARAAIWQANINWVPDAKFTMDLALSHARRAVELDDQSPYAHSILGWVLLIHKDGESALSEARRACEIDPDSAEAKLFLSLALASTGHGEEALRTIETAMLLQPHPSSFYFYALGMSRFVLADFEGAIAAFLRGIEINPSFMPNHYDLAVTYGVCGHVDAALSEAAIVKADWPDVSTELFLSPQWRAIWRRGMKVAGLA